MCVCVSAYMRGTCAPATGSQGCAGEMRGQPCVCVCVCVTSLSPYCPIMRVDTISTSVTLGLRTSEVTSTLSMLRCAVMTVPGAVLCQTHTHTLSLFTAPSPVCPERKRKP